MLDKLAIIRRVIEEHHKVRENLSIVGRAVNDLEALFSLRKEYDWAISTTEAMLEKQRRLQQTLAVLAEGLGRHFEFEEDAFPGLFSEVLMQALLFDHQEIRDDIAQTTSLVSKPLEGLSREELLSARSRIQQAIENLHHTIEDHAAKEETVLLWMEKGLEKGARGQQPRGTLSSG